MKNQEEIESWIYDLAEKFVKEQEKKNPDFEFEAGNLGSEIIDNAIEQLSGENDQDIFLRLENIVYTWREQKRRS